ncbi:MAG: dihydrolipoyl dehydrogenase [Promethearchaeota archaeon]
MIINTDIAVIGGGPGGYVCAIRCSQFGAKVILIEKETVGGTCSNRGCIPAKAFVESSIRFKQMKEGKKFGLSAKDLNFDFASIQKRKQRIVKQLVKGVEFLLQENHIQVIKGTGSFIDSKTIEITGGVDKYIVKADKIIIATGSKPFKVPIPGIDGKNVITSDKLLEFNEVPESMVIIGGGAIGDEFASVLSSFGTKVTIIEMLSHLIPMEDEEIAIELEKAFRRQKINVHTSCRVTKIEDDDQGQKLVTYLDSNGNEQQANAQCVLLSVGRIPEIKGLNPETAGIKVGKRGIIVNSKLETNIEGIYAIGDCIEPPHPMLAYTASLEGEIAAENALGHEPKEIDYFSTPSCIFTDPEVSSTGLREREAREKEMNVLIGKFPYKGIGKAVIHGEPRGLVKVILDADTHEVLGCHIIGAHATELIAEPTLAVSKKLTAEDIIETQHCHPVFYEIFKEAILDGLDRAIHK